MAGFHHDSRTAGQPAHRRKNVWPKLFAPRWEHDELRVELVNDYSFSNTVAQRSDISIQLGNQIYKDMIAVRIAPDEILAVMTHGSAGYESGRVGHASGIDQAVVAIARKKT